MRFIPMRFTIGRLMITVAIVAVALGGDAARRRWIANRGPALSRSQLQSIGLAAKHLGPGHWAASKDLKLSFHDASRGYWIYARDYQSLKNGDRAVLSPFAIIWRSPDGRNVRTVTGDIVRLDLHDPMGLRGGGLNLSTARMEGNVVFSDNKSTSRADGDSISKPLPSVDFDQQALNAMGGLSMPPTPH